ncbi:MAG: hypothetical protein UT33_C0013G0033 [Candidatus Peregrinibacteria bacterium GW2011_GWC2_39_14]|nr:MAG: hypothetical protein US92_C0007G0084 [Candidatus Peregrinibacteria bacterium GW2011_GWA2_38_36]KKR05181.1 MAG: hypothetical protein UT33_C0013G0033 [Candidatus Peregrinibacteria bacterium GW2011_GWC2_39_14]
MASFTPDQILALPDEEIVKNIEQNDAFAAYLRKLQLEIYSDDTLSDVRDALSREAIDQSSVDCPWNHKWSAADRQAHREKTYPLAFGADESIDIRVKTLARVRCAIKRAYPDISFDSRSNNLIQNTLQRTQDGDLMLAYNDCPKSEVSLFAGKDILEVMFEWNPNFSPELLLRFINDYYHNITPTEPSLNRTDTNLIIGILAEVGRLPVKAWQALLEKNDETSTKMRSIWNTTDVRPEVLDLIMTNDDFALFYRARTEQPARDELLRRGDMFHGADLELYFESKPLGLGVIT